MPMPAVEHGRKGRPDGAAGDPDKALHGTEQRYLIVACTVITDVPEPAGP
jgi:hypothetical protein